MERFHLVVSAILSLPLVAAFGVLAGAVAGMSVGFALMVVGVLPGEDYIVPCMRLFAINGGLAAPVVAIAQWWLTPRSARSE